MYVRGWRKVDPRGCLTTRLARMAGSGFSERPSDNEVERKRERKTTSGDLWPPHAHRDTLHTQVKPLVKYEA